MSAEVDRLKWLHLRAVEESDLDTIKSWQSDPRLRDDIVGYPFPINDQKVSTWLQDLHPSPVPSTVHFAIEFEKRPIGLVSLRDINWIHRCASTSIYIGDPRLRGLGLGRGSMALLTDYAFRSLGLHRLSATILALNTKSIAMFSSLGFVHEGDLRDRFFVGGEWHMALSLSLLATDSHPPLAREANVLT